MRQRTLKKPFSIDVTPFLSIWVASILLLFFLPYLLVTPLGISPFKRIVYVRTYTPLPSKIRFVHPKKPTYFDCSPEGVTIRPGNMVVGWSDFESRSNAVVQLLDNIETNRSKEYVVLLVRPGSYRYYSDMRSFCSQRSIDMTADAIDADYQFSPPPR